MQKRKNILRENIRRDEIDNISINELNENKNDEEIITVIKYLYYNKIIIFCAGLFSLA